MSTETHVTLTARNILWCPYCRHDTAFTSQGISDKSFRVPNEPRQANAPKTIERHLIGALFQCSVCAKPILVIAECDNSSGWIERASCQFWPPGHKYDVAAAIPQDVASAFREAMLCQGVGAWNACGTMARLAMQLAVLQQGGQGRDLYAQIESLRVSGLITPKLVDYVHQVRTIGRDGAHGDTVFANLSRDDADDAVEFCYQIFNLLYVLPERLSNQKSRRPQ